MPQGILRMKAAPLTRETISCHNLRVYDHILLLIYEGLLYYAEGLRYPDKRLP